jgi:predicted RNase H-like HicB family nuclease
MILTHYIQAAMSRADYEKDGEGYFGEIAILPEVWASGATLEECRQSLQEVLELWIVSSLLAHQTIPEIGDAHLDPIKADELTDEELAEVEAAIESARTEGTVSLAEVMDVRTPA